MTKERAALSGSAPAKNLFEEAKQLHQTGQLAAAEQLYRQILASDPHHADAMHLLGLLTDQAGRPAEGAAWIERAIGIKDASFFRNNLGNILRRLGRNDQASAQYRLAIALKPNADAHYNLGNLQLDQDDFEEATESYRRALKLKPDHAEAHLNLGNALRGLDQLPEALKEYREAVRVKPNYAEAHYNLGNALLDLGKPLEAIPCYERAIALRPLHAETYLNLGNAYRNLGRFEEAIAEYKRAIETRPEYAEAYTNEAMTRLMAGDFAEGWRLYEWRWRTRQMQPHGLKMPLWDGGDLAGKAVLLHCEQGFGDAIQFVRYAPLVEEWGGRVMLSCPAPLARIFASVKGIAKIFPEGADLPTCDSQAPLMSLPMLFGTRLETIPANMPYLVPPASLVASWEARIPDKPGLRVGLVWAGNPRISRPEARAVDRRRSMKLEQMAPLAMKGVTFFSLQKGAGADQASSPPEGMNLVDFMDEVEDFADTAALIANLDLVVGVDTSVIHLAGAMGKPVWVLSRHDGCWRWLKDREDSPWYPSLRLFRQEHANDWAPVMKKVRQALEELLKG